MDRNGRTKLRKQNQTVELRVGKLLCCLDGIYFVIGKTDK